MKKRKQYIYGISKTHRRKIRKYAKKLKTFRRRRLYRINRKKTKSCVKNSKIIRWERCYIFNPRTLVIGGESNATCAAICNIYPSLSITTNNIPGVPINSITYPDHLVNLLVNYTAFKVMGYSWTITISTPHTNVTE